MNNKNNSSKIPYPKLFVISCIFAIILGVALHFIYSFLNKPFIVGLFFPVNESIWEHLKLVLMPITAFGIVYNFIYKNNEVKTNNFWYYLLKATLFSMLIIVFGHYGYKFIFKEVPDIVNIIIYIISIIIAFYKIYINIKKTTNNNKSINKNSIGIITFVLIFILFILFTIYPPQIELFRDPITNTFGIFML